MLLQGQGGYFRGLHAGAMRTALTKEIEGDSNLKNLLFILKNQLKVKAKDCAIDCNSRSGPYFDRGIAFADNLSANTGMNG
jgi:hypothetical protein